MKKGKKILVAVVVLLLGGGIAYLTLSGKEESLIVAKTSPVETGTISTVVTATGTIEATKQVEVGTQVSGVVEKIYVDYNSVVKAGQLIAELDKENLSELLSQAQSAYDVALNEQRYLQTIFDRQKSLYASSVISKSDYQEAEYNLKTAKGTTQQRLSDLKKAKTNLGYANIYSPINGVVLSRDVDEGQTVAASYSTPTLFTIAEDLREMQVEADVDEADIGNVKKGQRVTFTVDAFPDESFTGSVTQVRLNATTTSNVVTYTVIIKSDNPDLKLKPGLTATVSIFTMEIKDVQIVPAQAVNFVPDQKLLKAYNQFEAPNAIDDINLLAGEGQHILWVKGVDGLKPRPVLLGANDGIHYQVSAGLADGEMVVTDLSREKAAAEKPEEQSDASSPFMPKPPGKRK